MKLSKLTKPELGEIKEYANFTEDEDMIFDLLSKGKSIAEIANKMSVCERTVNRRILSIKEKVRKMERYKWL